MKKSKKLVSLIVAAVMAFSVVIAPAAAFAKGAPTIGAKKWGNFVITSVNPAQIKLKSLTKAGKKKTSFTVCATYKLDSKFTDQKTKYKVVGVQAKAFSGSKAKTIVIKASFKPAAAKNMLVGSKAAGKKVTIKVPAKQVSAWKAAAKKGVFGKGFKVTIKKI